MFPRGNRGQVFAEDASAPLRGAGERARPDFVSRLLAVAYHLGLGPMLRPFNLRRDDPYVQHHFAQALMILLLLLLLVLAGFLYWVLLTLVIPNQRAIYESIPCPDGWSPPERDMIPIVIGLVAWLALWAVGVVLAAIGSMRDLPLIARLARRPRLLRLGRVANVVLWAGVLLIASSAVYASSLTREDDEPAPVYFLYDDMGFVPRWVFNLGCFRIARAANERWGPSSVVVAPLDEHHLRLALQHGRLVFLAAHGNGGNIQTRQLWIAPPPLAAEADLPRCICIAPADAADGQRTWTAILAGGDLQFVYNSACDSGRKAEEWEKALAPAEVKTFDRLSTVAEHIVWLWGSGAERVRGME
jgi:hypothetical protein